MYENIELMKYLYENATNARKLMNKIINIIINKENKIIEVLYEAGKTYFEYISKTNNFFKEVIIKKPKCDLRSQIFIFKIKNSICNDNSDANIAIILTDYLKHSKMEIERVLKAYQDSIDEESRSIANDYINFHKVLMEKIDIYL